MAEPNYLKSLRIKQTGLSQREAGYIAGFQDGSKLSRYEAQSRMPDIKTARCLERLYDSGLPELFPNEVERIEMIGRAAFMLDQISKQSPEDRAEAKRYLKRLIATLEHPKTPPVRRRVVAFDPVHRGFAVAVLESDPVRVIDWEMVQSRGRSVQLHAQKAMDIIERYRPDLVAVEDYSSKTPPRGRTAKLLVASILSQTKRSEVRTVAIPQEKIRERFAAKEAENKQEIAEAIAQQFPELNRILPKPRQEMIGSVLKATRNEDYWMGVFDATALGITALNLSTRPKIE